MQVRGKVAKTEETQGDGQTIHERTRNKIKQRIADIESGADMKTISAQDSWNEQEKLWNVIHKQQRCINNQLETMGFQPVTDYVTFDGIDRSGTPVSELVSLQTRFSLWDAIESNSTTIQLQQEEIDRKRGSGSVR